ncbi:hypothetical protein NT6N_14150 [Oceaniferula spumae]|uniref:Uncharacterized protein n=1 Tax=Oceaniferula spumae TaxID=2979115 RepID=A0AAT9FKB4_9BACT
MASSTAAHTRQPKGKPKWSSITLVVLGLGCMATGIGLKRCSGADALAAESSRNASRANLAHSSNEKSARTSRRNTLAAGKKQNLPSHLIYLSDAKRQLTVTEVQDIIDEVKQASLSETIPTNLKTLRRFRDAQIDLVVKSFSRALSLSPSQAQEMEGHLAKLADSQFSAFAEKYQLGKPDSGFEHEGRRYLPVSASVMIALCHPSIWLKSYQIFETCSLNEDQVKILMPANTGQSSGFYEVPTGRYDIAPRIRDPLTGTVSGFPRGATPDFPIMGNLLPLTTNQGFLLQELMEKKKANEPNQLNQALFLTREQLTLSLLLEPEAMITLKQELGAPSD